MPNNIDDKTLAAIGRVIAETWLPDGSPHELVKTLIKRRVLLTREQVEARVQAAQAAALEMAAQLRPQAKYLNAIENLKFKEGYETGWNDYRADIRSLAPTDALREAKAQAVKAALDRLWEVWRAIPFDIKENPSNVLQQAMEKVKRERENTR